MTPIRFLGLGSCLLWQPLYPLMESGRAKRTLDDAGFNRSPACYCLDDAMQFVRFLIGEFDVPAPLRPVCDIAPTWEWEPGWRKCLTDCEIVLLEVHSPIRIGLGPYSLIRGELINHVTDPLIAKDDDLRRAVNAWWYQGLLAGKDSVRAEAGETLAAAVDGSIANPDAARTILREARPHRRTQAELVEALAYLQDVLDRPIATLTAIHRYLPDGRMVPWPARYLEETIAAARALNLPVFQPSETVQRHGVERAWKGETGPYQEEFYPVLGDALFAFAEGVLSAAPPPASGETLSSLIPLRPPFEHWPSHGNHCWRAPLPDETLPESDDNEHPERSAWVLLEDGAPIGSPHAPHRDIGRFGGGDYSHWGSSLYFSTSDNSDPNSNGRHYAFSLVPQLGLAGEEHGRALETHETG